MASTVLSVVCQDSPSPCSALLHIFSFLLAILYFTAYFLFYTDFFTKESIEARLSMLVWQCRVNKALHLSLWSINTITAILCFISIILLIKDAKNMKKHTTWYLLIMLNISQIIWSIASCGRRLGEIGFMWHIEWFVVHWNTLKDNFENLLDTITAVNKYLNIILGIERMIAIKYPLKYKIICTKRKICTATISCILWAALFKFPWDFPYANPKMLCVDRFNSQLYGFSNRFRYYGMCDRFKKIFAYPGWSRRLRLRDIIEAVTFHVIPIIILIVVSIITINTLRNTLFEGNNETNISEKAMTKRKQTERQLTKFSITIVVNCIIISLLIGTQVVLYIININQVLGIRVFWCTRAAIDLLLCFIWVFNPIIYFLFNITLKQKLRAACKCFK